MRFLFRVILTTEGLYIVEEETPDGVHDEERLLFVGRSRISLPTTTNRDAPNSSTRPCERVRMAGLFHPDLLLANDIQALR
jgi:hypothetical protein